MLVTGLSTYWGGRLAQALEGFEQIEAIIGVDSREPTLELERTEYVKVGNQHSLLQRIVRAAEIDTVIDARMIVNSLAASPRDAHENNVIGTMNILAACTGADSPVRKFIFKSSSHYYGSEQDDPAFFTERMRRPHPPRTLIERDMVEAEDAVAEFADKQPGVDGDRAALRQRARAGRRDRASPGCSACRWCRCCSASIRGFSSCTRTTSCTRSSTRRLNQVPGTFNVAADGVLALSEASRSSASARCRCCRRSAAACCAAPLRRLGFRVPDEMTNLLRFGRGLDNRLLKATGFRYGYTSRETVLKLGEHLRLEPILRGRG